MKTKIDWKEGKYPSFDISLGTDEGEAFMTIKGCSIKEYQGKKFIGFPAKKNDQTGKWWSHVWASDEFQAAIIAKAEKARPVEKDTHTAAKANAFNDMDDDIPF